MVCLDIMLEFEIMLELDDTPRIAAEILYGV